MSQQPGPYPHSSQPLPQQMPGYGGGPPGPLYPQPRPQIVHVVAKPGGLWRAMSIVAGLFLFGAVFFVGLMFGVFGMIARADLESTVIRTTYRHGGPQTVAIIPVTGPIDDRQAEFVHAAVRHVLDDGSVRAVVLRVDSPGGGVSASDQIWYEVKRLRDAGLPVVASYGGVAASGGYYISCGCDHIMAEETCMTGSIGVIAQVLTLEGLMDKVGVKPVTLVATGSPEKSVANDTFRTWDDKDKEKIRTMLDSAYATFNKRVKDGRKSVITDPAKIDALANGSIYTASQARESGLIDTIGYLDDSIKHAETLAGISTGGAEVITIRQPPTLFGDFMSSRNRTTGTAFNADMIRGLVNDLAAPRVMYLMN